jgi:hypothetical protein
MSMQAAILLGLVLATASGAAQGQVIPKPTVRNRPVDACVVPRQNCGQPAADRFCQLQGFQKASVSGFRLENSQFTLILGTNQVCTSLRHEMRQGYIYNPVCHALKVAV